MRTRSEARETARDDQGGAVDALRRIAIMRLFAAWSAMEASDHEDAIQCCSRPPERFATIPGGEDIYGAPSTRPQRVRVP